MTTDWNRLSPEQLARVDDLTARAMAMPVTERRRFLEEAAAADERVLREALSLVESADRSTVGDPLRRPVVDLILGAHAAGSLPQWDPSNDDFGRYRVVERIGEGGFGVVFLAEQTEPIRRRVALKVIKPGMDSASVLARFEQERQALAVMDHPNVARVIDAGVTRLGRPFFVMEHVSGEPITRFADRHRLTIRERLELFVPVCEAVQHAHTKGIIHRDIKPSNILVSPAGEQGDSGAGLARGMLVKVIDFGVAKAIDRTLTEKTVFTEHGQIIGTPEYMSPEQAEMGAVDIDTRTDVYSLGIVLYELLSGTLPFDSAGLRSAGYAEIQRIIREVDPPRPSTRLGSADDSTGAEIARARQTEREQIAVELRRELEWIPLKAMRKDRRRRYASADALAEDVRRYLDGRPLEAAPESPVYLMRKFVGRNRVQVASLVAVMFALAAGFGTALWQARRAAVQRDAALIAQQNEAGQRARADERAATAKRAERAERDARQRVEQESRVAAAMSEILQKDVIGAANPMGPNPDMLIRDALEAVAQRIPDRLPDDPVAQARIRKALGDSFLGLGLYHKAEEQQRLALEIKLNEFGEGHPETADSMSDLGVSLLWLDRAADAEPLFRKALTTYLEHFGPHHKRSLDQRHNLASSVWNQGRPKEAVKEFLELVLTRERGSQPLDNEMVITLSNIASAMFDYGDYEGAISFGERSYNARVQLWGAEDPRTGLPLAVIGSAHQGLGNYDEAARIGRLHFEERQRVVGPEHPTTIHAQIRLGYALVGLKRFDEAFGLFRRAEDVCERNLGPDHSLTLRARAANANALVLAGEYQPALVEITAVMDAFLRSGKVNSLLHGNLLEIKGDALRELGRSAEAVAVFSESEAVFARAAGPDSPHTERLKGKREALETKLAEPAPAAPLPLTPPQPPP